MLISVSMYCSRSTATQNWARLTASSAARMSASMYWLTIWSKRAAWAAFSHSGATGMPGPPRSVSSISFRMATSSADLAPVATFTDFAGRPMVITSVFPRPRVRTPPRRF